MVPLPPSGRRPNTIAPDSFLPVQDAQLISMTDEELIRFADRVLSLVIPWGTKRSTILTRIVNCAVAARDGR